MDYDQFDQIEEENPEAVQQGQEQIREVLQRSATDWEFRQKLLSDPREAIAEHTGQALEDIPETIDLVFVENEADATVVLPDPIGSETELNEGELDTVAGGSALAAAAVGAGFAVAGAAAGAYAMAMD